MLIDVLAVIIGFFLAGLIFHVGCSLIHTIELYHYEKLIEYRNKLRAKSAKEFWEEVNK